LTGTPGIGQVHATQAQLNSMAQKCEETGQSVANGMAQLISRIEAMNNGAFAGSANSALQDVSAQLNDGLRRIINALDELAGKISDASKQFGVQDEDAANTIRQAASSVHDGGVASILRG
jgi:WXG100 family type VII secretion target